mgnify:CR=1 FL=1
MVPTPFCGTVEVPTQCRCPLLMVLHLVTQIAVAYVTEVQNCSSRAGGVRISVYLPIDGWSVCMASVMPGMPAEVAVARQVAFRDARFLRYVFRDVPSMPRLILSSPNSSDRASHESDWKSQRAFAIACSNWVPAQYRMFGPARHPVGLNLLRLGPHMALAVSLRSRAFCQ